MKDLHSLINELGARLNEEDKEEAIMILNQLYLNGYDDLFICIALIRVLAREDFYRNSYLFSYQPFLDETNELKEKYKRLNELHKDMQVYYVYNSSGDTLRENDRALIDEYNELFNETDDEEVKQNYLDYLYMKYCFSFVEIMNCNIEKYKKIILGTNEGGFQDF